MNLRGMFSLFVIAVLGTAILPGDSISQQKSIRDQLIGAWTLISVETMTKDGTVLPYLEGANVKGLLVFTANHYSFQIISEIPKLASNDRLQTTPEEDRAIAHGVISNWGRYSVSEADSILTLHNERSSFPNQNGAVGKRVITSITAAELKFSVPTTRTGNSQNLAWRRAE